jgi:hypothetical protein
MKLEHHEPVIANGSEARLKARCLEIGCQPEIACAEIRRA